MNIDVKYYCVECDEKFSEGDSRLGDELFCPICKSRLDSDTSSQIDSSSLDTTESFSKLNSERSDLGETKGTDIKQRFCVERVAFIVITAVIAGALGGEKTDLGPFGLMGMVGFLMFCFYSVAKTLIGIGGFFETLAADDSVPAFDWKRFLLDPLYFLGVCVALLIVTGIAMLIKWAFSGGQ